MRGVRWSATSTARLDATLKVCIIGTYHGAIFHEAENGARLLDGQKPGRSTAQGVSLRH